MRRAGSAGVAQAGRDPVDGQQQRPAQLRLDLGSLPFVPAHPGQTRFFEQAKQCYTEWGSLVKVECVTRQLNCVLASMHDDRDDTLGDNSFVDRLFDVVKSYSTIDLN